MDLIWFCHIGPEKISGPFKAKIHQTFGDLFRIEFHGEAMSAMEWLQRKCDYFLKELREDKDFTDVTLVCEDGKQVEAHKAILVAFSPFFMEILKKNKHHHPLIYMRGLTSNILLSIIDFLYLGEGNVLQDNLESFLALAEELKLKGLTGNEPSTKVEDMTDQSHHVSKASDKREIFMVDKKTLPNRPETLQAKTVALVNNPIIAEPDKLDEQIKSMMTVTDVQSNDRHHKLAICNICGKEGPSNNMPSHIEANHITGVSHSCNICGKSSRSRDALRKHKHRCHN